jgi:hypothetical protein
MGVGLGVDLGTWVSTSGALRGGPEQVVVAKAAARSRTVTRLGAFEFVMQVRLPITKSTMNRLPGCSALSQFAQRKGSNSPRYRRHWHCYHTLILSIHQL